MRFLLLPTFLLLTLSVTAKAEDECSALPSPDICTECAEDEYWAASDKIRQAEKEQEAAAKAKGDEGKKETKLASRKATNDLLKLAEELKKKVRACEQIVPAKRTKPGQKQ